eukprot:GILJ01010435.1.p1 GENE.GILJ01010435.1~~GILJ01010435.1.p1  ORF type:complete len:249 (-),score=22.95 GILJ01010435.1:44-790(-)
MSLFSRLSRKQIISGAASVYATGLFAAYQWQQHRKPEPVLQALPNEVERRQIIDSLANKYDKIIKWDEILLGIPLRRRTLMRIARGDVLEVAVGTGRNLEYYQPHCKVVATDTSQGMLATAAAKYQSLPAPKPSVTFQAADAQRLPFPDHSFDTVVDTFGLCSFEDPVATLRELKRVKRPDGQVLLLEHGESKYGWLAERQRKGLARHVHSYACFWNRDIESLVREAGLEIVEFKRTNFGTTFFIVAR